MCRTNRGTRSTVQTLRICCGGESRSVSRSVFEEANAHLRPSHAVSVLAICSQGSVFSLSMGFAVVNNPDKRLSIADCATTATTFSASRRMVLHDVSCMLCFSDLIVADCNQRIRMLLGTATLHCVSTRQLPPPSTKLPHRTRFLQSSTMNSSEPKDKQTIRHPPGFSNDESLIRWILHGDSGLFVARCFQKSRLHSRCFFYSDHARAMSSQRILLGSIQFLQTYRGSLRRCTHIASSFRRKVL